MGSSASKTSDSDALLLCKERMKQIKQAVDSRDALSAAHLSYIQSLCSVGTALRRFIETELLVESSFATSEVDKSPSRSSYASPSPSHFVEHMGSPSGSPLSPPRLSSLSYMRATGATAMTVTVNSSATHFVEEDSLTFPLPPPPLPPEIGSSWDFFDPTHAMSKIGLNSDNSAQINLSRITGLRQLTEEEMVLLVEDEEVKMESYKEKEPKEEVVLERYKEQLESANFPKKNSSEDGTKSVTLAVNRSPQTMAKIASSELGSAETDNSKQQKELCAQREDASEFITHRAKDLLSSMRDIEHRFTRAAEAGDEVSRMLETKKIKLGISSELIDRSSSRIFSVLNRVCCKEPSLNYKDSAQNVTKVITWKRSVSSLSSSSQNPLASAVRDYSRDSTSDFVEQFAMISGSHSSTLDRLYAWERKLYDEIKASEYIRKAYDQKCSQLRHQFARDADAKLIDKTRALVKDLHSRIRVAIQSVDSISKRIEKMRDEELLPQLVELIQGLIKMWKSMLECHHAQFITISLAYLSKNSSGAALGESHRQALIHLRNEIECFSQSFSNWVNAHKSYIEALNSWLQRCILQPQERKKGRKAIFPPRHALPPPIFVLCSDWLAGLKSLPSGELCDSISAVMSILHDTFEHPEEKQAEKMPEKCDEPEKGEGHEGKENQDRRSSNLDIFQTGLTRLFDRLKKFSEASLKVHEDVKQGNDIACAAYMKAETW